MFNPYDYVEEFDDIYDEDDYFCDNYVNTNEDEYRRNGHNEYLDIDPYDLIDDGR